MRADFLAIKPSRDVNPFCPRWGKMTHFLIFYLFLNFVFFMVFIFLCCINDFFFDFYIFHFCILFFFILSFCISFSIILSFCIWFFKFFILYLVFLGHFSFFCEVCSSLLLNVILSTTDFLPRIMVTWNKKALEWSCQGLWSLETRYIGRCE